MGMQRQEGWGADESVKKTTHGVPSSIDRTCLKKHGGAQLKAFVTKSENLSSIHIEEVETQPILQAVL